MAILTFAAAEVHAQGTWDAILTIDPYPSPYYSDWDANPNISSLTVINSTSSPARVRIHFNVIDRTNRIVVSGRSEPEAIDAGATVIFDSPYDVAGSTTHDTELEETAARTGRLPEGDYTACAVAADEAGFVLTESCSTFTIVYPDPPLLLGPLDGEVVDQPDPLLLWTPVQVPLDYQLSYIVRVAEVLEGQTPAEALRSNIPHYQSLDAQLPSLRYPIDARPFEHGKTYAWTVQALDQNGYSAAANDGRSEIWSFRYDDGTATEATTAATTLTLTNSADSGEAPPASVSLNEICSGSDAGAVVMHVITPFGFEPFDGSPAALHRDPASAEWWLFTQRQERALLMHGDCSGPLGGLQWVASRKTGRNQKLNEWLSLRSIPPELESIEYGVFVLALGSSKVEVPASFREGSEFLSGHELSVMRGLNAFAVINLREHSMWPFLEQLGYDERQIEIQGFAGFDSQMSIGIGGALGSDGSSEANIGVKSEQTFMTLSAALPERQPIGPLAHLIGSMRLGIELELKRETALTAGATRADSQTAYGTSMKQTYELVPKLTHTMTLHEDRFENVRGARELVGSLGLSLERETTTKSLATQIWMKLQRSNTRVASGMKTMGSWFGADPDAVVCAAAPETETSAHLAVEYAMAGDIVLGAVVIEKPKLEVKVQLADDKGAVSGDARGLEFAIAAVIKGAEWGEDGIALGVTVERAEKGGGAADKTCSPRPRSNAVTGMTRPRSDAVTTVPGRQRSDAVAEPSPGRERSDANADQTNPPTPASNAQWKFKWRIGTEKMPMMDLLKGIPGLLGSVWNAITPP
ncbi:MAG TPA: hypothetical protein VK933_18245 [Longimicrobiales bacterium]|nr:hypothetical protein [Longimicrobiales bacterium]